MDLRRMSLTLTSPSLDWSLSFAVLLSWNYPDMPPKRSGNGVDEDLTGREKKKLKVSAARTIAVQPNQQAGPSSAARGSQNGMCILVLH